MPLFMDIHNHIEGLTADAVAHAHQAAEAMGGARLELLEGAGHFLPWRNADWFLPILEDFLKSTTPAHVPEARWRELLISAPLNNEEE
mgnify:CR=1 FL=1